MTSKERLTVFENILARTSGGGDTLKEYAKAMSTINGMQTYNEVNTPVVPQEAITEPISTEPTQGITPENNMP